MKEAGRKYYRSSSLDNSWWFPPLAHETNTLVDRYTTEKTMPFDNAMQLRGANAQSLAIDDAWYKRSGQLSAGDAL